MAYTASALSSLLEGIDIPKLMVLTDRHAPDEVRRLMQEDLVGELSVN